MKPHRLVPEALVEGATFPATKGFFDGTWYFEEDLAAVRFGIRTEARLHEESSEFQKLTVYETALFGRLLTLDDIVMFTERDEFVYHEMLVHVPLCAIPDPKAVLIIGGGDCGCLREVLKHPSVERVVQCDIDERVTRVCERYFPWVRPALSDPRVELVFDDGIRFVGRQSNAFDCILVDSTDPKGPAIGLFLNDFYEKIACALRPGGVMAAQTESPHWESDTVGVIYDELRTSFRHVAAYLGMVPTYPSGCWTWAYGSNDRRHDDFFDRPRAQRIAADCLYYNSRLQEAAFVLPNFARRAVAGENVFERFEERLRLSPVST